MELKIGDKVRISDAYPADRDHPYTLPQDKQMHGLIGTVVYIDDLYVHVQPLPSQLSEWPSKIAGDAYPDWWHFKTSELEKLQ